jgi:hypothetical protein
MRRGSPKNGSMCFMYKHVDSVLSIVLRHGMNCVAFEHPWSTIEKIESKPSDRGRSATICRTYDHTRIHMAILRVCDTCALDAPDRSALTVRWDLLFMGSFALCLYDTRSVCTTTRSVVACVRVRPQEMASYDVMTGRLLYYEGGVTPRGAVYLNCTIVALGLQSQLGR